MNTPFFSIIIPTHNRANLIIDTIKTCLNQDIPIPYEILIVDDGSTDKTTDLINEISETKIKVFSISNRERGAARNFGTRNSQGKYITFLDSDDHLHHDHLSNAIQLIKKDNYPEILHLGYQIIDNDKNILQKFNAVPFRNLNKAVVQGNYMSCMGVFLRRDIALNHPFSENRELSGSEDWLLWLQLAARFKIHFSEEISSSMIDHDGRSIKNFSSEALDKRTELITDSLRNDDKFREVYGMKTINRIQAHMLTYSGLHLMLSNKKRDAWKRFLKGLRLNPLEIFSRRTLAVIKHSLK